MSSWRHELTTRLESLKLRPEREAEIVEELSQHLDDRVRELEAGGVAPDDAYRTALADLDAPGALAEKLAAIEARSPLQLPPPGVPSRGRWFGALRQDIRHSIRSLRRTPAFTLAVVGALALTIGPTTAILSVGNWLIWRPPPGVVEPGRLAVVWFGNWTDTGGVSPRSVSDLNVADLRDAAGTFSDVAGWQESSVSVAVEGAPPRPVGSAHADARFFDLLGVRPAAGRSFTPEENQAPFGSPVAVISDRLARGAFGGPDAAVGAAMTVNGRPMRVVGVLPEGFVGARPTSDVDVWIPSHTYYYVNHFRETSLERQTARERGIFYTFVARLAPGATFDQLRAELDLLVPALAERYPDDNDAFTTARARVFPGLGPHELQRERFAGLVGNLILIGAVLLVLGCANVANVLISRGVRRQHERAVRVALGASRARIAQLLLTESCLLAAAGAALGVGLAWVLKDLITTLLLPGATGAATVVVPIDARVLLTTLGVSVACGLLAGLAPAWIGSASRPSSGIGRGGPRTSAGGSRVRAGFAVVQLALSLALLTNAFLLVGTLRNLAGVDTGIDPTGVTLHYGNLSGHGYDSDRAMVYSRALLDRLSAAPALDAVSLSSGHPFGSGFLIRLQDPAASDGEPISVYTNLVTPGYFDVLGIPVHRGRAFTNAEAMADAGPDGSPVVLDELLARRLFGEADPLGRRVRVAATLGTPEHDLVVAGVSRNARWRGLTGDPDLIMYVPFSYSTIAVSRPVVMVRSRLSPREAGDIVQGHASAIDPTLPFAAPRALTDAMARGLAERRVLAWVLTMLGALGFLLTAVGLYGLLAQMVNERTREFGIRMAIGADRTHVVGLVLRQALLIAAIGGAIGLALAYFGTRVVEAQLFGLTRLEPWVYVASAASLGVVVLAASLWPARAATRIQPVEALRME
jgi:predicted permease